MVSTQWPKKSQSFWRFNFSSRSKVSNVCFFTRHDSGQLAPKIPNLKLRPSFFWGGGIPLNPLNLGWARRFGRYNLPKWLLMRNLPKFNGGRTLENRWRWKRLKITRLKRKIIWSKLRELKCRYHLYQRLPLSVPWNLLRFHLHFGVPNVIFFAGAFLLPIQPKATTPCHWWVRPRGPYQQRLAPNPPTRATHLRIRRFVFLGKGDFCAQVATIKTHGWTGKFQPFSTIPSLNVFLIAHVSWSGIK